MAKAKPTSNKCPNCGAGPEQRQVVHAFGGDPYTACTKCGHKFQEKK